MIKKIQEINPSKKTILFTEFDPLRYNTIFSPELQNLSNILLYNRRRPAIWNLQSLSILKKSGCGIISENHLMDKTLSNSIQKNDQLSKNFIQSLLNHEDFLESFFAINGASFWQSIKHNFIQLCKSRFKNALTEIMLAKKLFEEFPKEELISYQFYIQCLVNIGQPHQAISELKEYLKKYPKDRLKTLSDAHKIHQYLLKNHNDFFTDCEIFVTLEPCNHEGKTPSCANLISKLKPSLESTKLEQ